MFGFKRRPEGVRRSTKTGRTLHAINGFIKFNQRISIHDELPPITHLQLQIGVELENQLDLGDDGTKLAARERNVELNVAIAARRGSLRA